MLLSSFEPLVIIVSCSEISKFGLFLGTIQDFTAFGFGQKCTILLEAKLLQSEGP